jgi:hypothetical protein
VAAKPRATEDRLGGDTTPSAVAARTMAGHGEPVTTHQPDDVIARWQAESVSALSAVLERFELALSAQQQTERALREVWRDPHLPLDLKVHVGCVGAALCDVTDAINALRCEIDRRLASASRSQS